MLVLYCRVVAHANLCFFVCCGYAFAFATQECDAALAYDAVATELRGSRARLNFDIDGRRTGIKRRRAPATRRKRQRQPPSTATTATTTTTHATSSGGADAVGGSARPVASRRGCVVQRKQAEPPRSPIVGAADGLAVGGLHHHPALWLPPSTAGGSSSNNSTMGLGQDQGHGQGPLRSSWRVLQDGSRARVHTRLPGTGGGVLPTNAGTGSASSDVVAPAPAMAYGAGSRTHTWGGDAAATATATATATPLPTADEYFQKQRISDLRTHRRDGGLPACASILLHRCTSGGSSSGLSSTCTPARVNTNANAGAPDVSATKPGATRGGSSSSSSSSTGHPAGGGTDMLLCSTSEDELPHATQRVEAPTLNHTERSSTRDIVHPVVVMRPSSCPVAARDVAPQ